MESKFHYTNERNVQIVIALLKAHGIHRVIASPGTTNMTFVGSIQNDPWFKIWSSVDERSAAYMACGMAAETGEPVVLSCTGATASRNYMPGLTEAYYRKLPVLAITSHRGESSIGHLKDQQIDRRTIPNDIANLSVTIPLVHTNDDEKYCVLEANKAILELSHRGGGPVHINLYTNYSKDFSVEEIKPVRVIKRYSLDDELPELKKEQKIAIFVGSHNVFPQRDQEAIERFCEKYNAIVLTDKTSGYYGKYKISNSLINAQKFERLIDQNFDILVHIGEVTGDTYGAPRQVKQVWRVSPDGMIRDYFGRLCNVFEMSELSFFNSYNSRTDNYNVSLYDQYKAEYERLYEMVDSLPFSNIWMAKEMHNKLPIGCELHLGIFHSLRSWNFFETDKSIKTYCNVGGFGIDGALSTVVGASLVNKNKVYYCILGDLAFFYDMNVLGNRHVDSNIRILLINNGKGNEFRLSMHPCNNFGDDADKYMAAAGHYGNKSNQLVKHYAEDLGYKYMCASNKEEFIAQLDVFLSPKEAPTPMLFEVFTEMEHEREALDDIIEIVLSTKSKLKQIVTESKIGKPVKDVLSLVRKIK